MISVSSVSLPPDFSTTNSRPHLHFHIILYVSFFLNSLHLCFLFSISSYTKGLHVDFSILFFLSVPGADNGRSTEHRGLTHSVAVSLLTKVGYKASKTLSASFCATADNTSFSLPPNMYNQFVTKMTAVNFLQSAQSLWGRKRSPMNIISLHTTKEMLFDIPRFHTARTPSACPFRFE